MADEVEEEEEVLPEVMPGLGEAGDELTLVEKWHAVFNGLKLQSAGVQGLLLCNRPSLTCLFKLEVRSASSARAECCKGVSEAVVQGCGCMHVGCCALPVPLPALSPRCHHLHCGRAIVDIRSENVSCRVLRLLTS